MKKLRALMMLVKILGALMMLGGIVFGLYVGLLVYFLGEIIQFINEIKSPEAIVAMSIVEIVFAGLAGWVSASVLISPGWYMVQELKRADPI